MVSRVTLIDAWPPFPLFWERVRGLPIAEQIDAWASDYMAPWPELLEKQQADYASEGENWRNIAEKFVFPYLDERLPAMGRAHDCLLEDSEAITLRAQETLGLSVDVVLVIYVGIGCGAGWVDRYAGSPAVLFGLENIAEEGWDDPAILTGLIAHEIGHLAHFYWLEIENRPRGKGPWWQLYSEGFAQRCEHQVLGRESWHMAANDAEGDWVAWCSAKLPWLAAEFLRTVDAGESVRPFFGSWFQIAGRKQTGYFLGHEIIRRLEAHMTMREIALMDGVDGRIRSELEQLSPRETEVGGTLKMI
jgi:hypothetical protein